MRLHIDNFLKGILYEKIKWGRSRFTNIYEIYNKYVNKYMYVNWVLANFMIFYILTVLERYLTHCEISVVIKKTWY